MRRIRQITAAILESQRRRDIQDIRVVSWQTRSLGMILAATSPHRVEGEDPVMEYASNLTLDKDELLDLADINSSSTEPQPVKPRADEPKYGLLQEVCKKGHSDEWVQFPDHINPEYKKCRKCEMQANNAAQATQVSEFAVGMFGKSMHGKPMPG